MTEKPLYVPPAFVSTEPPDPALAENLAEIRAMLGEIGAEGIFILRGITDIRLGFKVRGVPADFEIAPCGLLLVARFPASDGGEAGLETWTRA